MWIVLEKNNQRVEENGSERESLKTKLDGRGTVGENGEAGEKFVERVKPNNQICVLN